MTFRYFLVALVTLATFLFSGCTQSATSSSAVYHLAVIASGQSRLVKAESLEKGLADRGYRPGENLIVTIFNAENQGDRLPDLTQQALMQQPDVLVTLGGVERIWDKITAVLKPEEQRRVAYVLARGGRFEDEKYAYQGDWLTHRYGKPLQIYNEKLGTTRNSMNGKRFVGVPTWREPVFADETPIDEVYPPSEWPFKMVSTKSQLMSPPSIGAPRLSALQPSNAIVMHQSDAIKLGLRSGDRVRVTSPGGSVEGVISVRKGIRPGTVGIEHGYGHWGLGARDETIENKVWHASGLRGKGVASNLLGIADPSRKGFSTLADFVVGSNARQAIPVKVEKI